MTIKDFLKSLIQIAKSDLAASNLLFSNGFYLQSTFYLQQGVEKGNKAFAIFNEFIKVDEIKHLGHDHIELHKKGINLQLGKLKILNDDRTEVREFIDTIASHTNIDYKGYIKSLEKSRDIKNDWQKFNIVEITGEELAGLLEEIDFEIDEPADTSKETRDKLVKQLKDKLQGFILPLVHKLKNKYPAIEIDEIDTFFLDDNNLDELAHTMLDFGEYLRKFIPAFYKIYILGFILYPLVSKVRYPDFEEKFDPMNIFTINHPLVNQQPRLHKLASTALGILESIMNVPISI
ncbi:MAG: HEPN domain-containing protein [Sphingobacteriales bacterium]|nr:HEPN domain-containing protein [Sphingobacteriales bacterium]MBI3717595.1 HEPN domain-containing protein [Sphingobacteriales bacterium]